MKVGIMTFHASHNCGSMLQAYALQQTLIRKYGVDVEIIDYSNWRQRTMYALFDIRPKKKAIKYDLKILPNVIDLQKMRKDYQKFMNEFLVLSPKSYLVPQQLKGIENRYDLLIAGGDQVWNIKCRDHDDAYFLNFAKNTKKVAYSPSLGAKNIMEEADDPSIYAEYLRDFEKISVREGNGRLWLETLTGLDVPIVADPTLLLTKSEWCSWLPVEDLKGDYIFNYAYYHDRPETNAAIQKISNMLGMPVYTIDYKSWCIYKLSAYGIEKFRNSGPIAMLSLMKNANLVLTQSFHGTLFAAAFDRIFWSYHNPYINSPSDDRARFLLKQLGLSERYITIDELPNRPDLMNEINYDPVQERISSLRKEGLKYIDSFMQ